jgi:hypothetical protein
MKRAVFRLDTGRGGWVRNTLAPINDKHETRFNLADATLFLTLLAVTVTVMRVFLAH